MTKYIMALNEVTLSESVKSTYVAFVMVTKPKAHRLNVYFSQNSEGFEVGSYCVIDAICNVLEMQYLL